MIRLFCALIGTGFSGIGLLFVYSGLPRSTVLTCDRVEPTQINCQQQEATAGIPTRRSSLVGLQSVKLQAVEVSGPEADYTQYQVWLLGRQGTLAFGATSRPEALQPTVTKLIQFREQSTPNSITVGGSTVSWPSLLVGSLAAGLGLWLASSALLPQGWLRRFITR